MNKTLPIPSAQAARVEALKVSTFEKERDVQLFLTELNSAIARGQTSFSIDCLLCEAALDAIRAEGYIVHRDTTSNTTKFFM